MPENSGLRLKVLASGLHQLAKASEMVSDELSAVSKPPPISTSGWQSSAATARRAAGRAAKDVSAVVARINARAAGYNAAGFAYAQNDKHGADRLHRVRR
jgi:hypothetical protein